MLSLLITLTVLVSAQIWDTTVADQRFSDFTCIGKSCYIGLWNAKRYNKASHDCEGRGGHLMTVKNSVEALVIELLLARAGDRVSSAWIGLEQPQKDQCTEESLPLRGFGWVTGDGDIRGSSTSTQYFNWKNHEKKCGNLCVSVGRDLLWEVTNCSTKTDGYFCEIPYTETCDPIYLTDGYNVSYSTNLGIVREELPFLPPGTQAVVSNVHVALWCQEQDTGEMKWTSYETGAWNCMVENGGCSFVCSGDVGNSKCECDQDSKLSSNGRSCDPPATGLKCFPDQSGNTCVCDEGYTLSDDGVTCKDIDDCESSTSICDQICTNTEGSFVCSCLNGYELTDKGCEDIDECNNPTLPCDHDCRNYNGSYSCVCFPGYVPDKVNPKKCKPFCNTTTCSAICNPNELDSCECPDGYIMDVDYTNTIVCIDIDECESGHCKYMCENLPGSYVCSCPDGQIMEKDNTCVDVEGSGGTQTPSTIPPFKPTSPDVHYIKQPIMALGICVGILSILTVLIAIICHLVKKHHMEQLSLDCNSKNPEKGVVLHQVKSTSPMKL